MFGLDFMVILKKALCMFIWTILKFHGKSTPPIWRREVMWRHVWSREWKRSIGQKMGQPWALCLCCVFRPYVVSLRAFSCLIFGPIQPRFWLILDFGFSLWVKNGFQPNVNFVTYPNDCIFPTFHFQMRSTNSRVNFSLVITISIIHIWLHISTFCSHIWFLEHGQSNLER